MMNKKTEDALRMAIEALENAQDMIGDGGSSIPNYFETQINACKAALESQESEQDPVAWISNDENHLEWRKGALLELGFKDNEILPLYTRPTKRLSDDEVDEMKKITEKEYYEQEPAAWKHKQYGYTSTDNPNEFGDEEDWIPLYTKPTKGVSDDSKNDY